MSYRNRGYRMALAEPGHGAEILKIIESGSFEGNIHLIYTRRPDAYRSLEKEGEGGVIMVAIDEAQDRVCGVAACSLRRLYINGEIKRVAYLSSLKVLPEYIGKMNALPLGYQFIYDGLRGQADYFYTTILEENHYARRLLEKRRKNMPHYEYFGDYTVHIMKTGQRLKANHQLRLEQGNESNREELLALINQEQRGYQLGVKVDEGALKTYLDIPIHCFYGVRDRRERLVAACALWDQTHYKQYIVTRYEGLLKYLPKESSLLHALGLPRLPRVNEAVRFFTLSLLSVQDNNPEVFDFLLRQLSYRPGYEFFVLGLHKRHGLRAGMAGFKSIPYKSRLYFVDFEKEPGFLNRVDASLPVNLECGLL